MSTELVERLRAACNGHPHTTIAWPHRVLHEAADELTALTAKVALLTEALRPFASEAARYGAYGDGSQRAWLNCTVADLRSARRALLWTAWAYRDALAGWW